MLVALLCANLVDANELIVSGLEEELAENVKLVAGEPPEDDRLMELYIELLPKQTRDALAAYGYFEPEVDVKSTNSNNGTIINLTVNAGSPVLIKSINVDVTGPGSTDATFQNAKRRIPLAENTVFISGDYEASKSLLLDVAQAKGYFDFKFITNTVLVSRTDRTANVNLVAESGPRFTFGDIKFDQNIFSDTFLNRWAPFKADDPYDATALAELNQNLQNSGYFTNVRVSPQRDVRYGPTVPVLVSLKRKESNQVALGIGYSTDERLRGKVTWGKPLINRQGHSAETELNLSRKRQAASFAYRIPRKNQPLYNFWGIEYGLRRTDVNNVESLLSRLNLRRVRRFASEWNESVFLRWERESFTVANENETTDLVLPGIQYTRNRSKGAPFLTWGQSSSFQFQYGNRELLSSIDFYKAEASFKYLRAVSSRNTFIFSLQYGAITTNDFNRVPVSQRFFAGGDSSIRGFDFQTVSPVDEDGDPKGGRYLETGSVEYNYRFADKWSFAMFADSGRAFNNFSTSHSTGVGIGIRWQSPVGPFRLDIARPISEGSFDDLQLHLSLGPEL